MNGAFAFAAITLLRVAFKQREELRVHFLSICDTRGWTSGRHFAFGVVARTGCLADRGRTGFRRPLQTKRAAAERVIPARRAPRQRDGNQVSRFLAHRSPSSPSAHRPCFRRISRVSLCAHDIAIHGVAGFTSRAGARPRLRGSIHRALRPQCIRNSVRHVFTGGSKISTGLEGQMERACALFFLGTAINGRYATGRHVVCFAMSWQYARLTCRHRSGQRPLF